MRPANASARDVGRGLRGENESGPRSGPALLRYALNRRDVCSLHAFGAALRFEADLLAFSEALEAVAANFGEVREQVVTAVIRGDEAEALCIVEPLDGTGIHKNP
jgi:hypothetical protein